MVMRGQIRDDATGDARWLEIGTDGQVIIKSADGATIERTLSPEIWWPLGGQFLLDPNEINGWGVVGPLDDSNTQDLGNVGAAPARTAGGIVFPFDVHLRRFLSWHRVNNAAAEAWGWVLFHQQKTAASNAVTSNYILDEVADNGGTGPRDYGNNQNQFSDIDLSGVAAAQDIPAGNVITLGVAAPTANTTNYFVQIQAGYLLLERA